MGIWIRAIAALFFFECSLGFCANGNLVANPDFDADISGWTVATSGASVTWSADNGYLGSPSMSMSVSSTNATASAKQCIVVAAPLNVNFFVHVETQTDMLSGGFTTGAVAFSNANCTGTNLGSLPAGTQVTPATGGMDIVLSDYALVTLTRSVQITLGVHTGATPGAMQQYTFDHVIFGDILFADDFEG